jgi:hypothetical protein
MSITINHQTENISATSGRLTITQPADDNGIRINHVTRATSTFWAIQLSGPNNEGLVFAQNNGSSTVTSYVVGRNYHIFAVNGSDAVTIDSSGNLLVGTTVDYGKITVVEALSGGQITVGTTTADSTTKFGGVTGIHYTSAEERVAIINAESNPSETNLRIGGGLGEYNAVTNIRFFTAANITTTTGTERMRIDSNGQLILSPAVAANPKLVQNCSNNTTAISFKSAGVERGSIYFLDSGVAYNTTSDYRLKTDVQPMTGASARVQALKPVNFEWIVNGTRVDGFLAHEAQEVVPEAVTGTKDAVDEDGKPVYQGIDQSKLVPLLTAALQEALTKIEALEARITALEA